MAIAAHAPSGSPELAAAAAEALGAGRAVLLERHGAVAVGAGLDEALGVAESIEHQSKVAFAARHIR